MSEEPLKDKMEPFTFQELMNGMARMAGAIAHNCYGAQVDDPDFLEIMHYLMGLTDKMPERRLLSTLPWGF